MRLLGFNPQMLDPMLPHPTRRAFLRGLGFAAAGVPLLRLAARAGLPAAPPQNTPAQSFADAPANLSWRIVMVSPDESGEPLVIRGTIFAADGRAPLEGARLYVYHTDSTGHYARQPADEWRHPRLRGWMKTGADGRYEFRTIKPAPYPGRQIPAHIHPTADAPGYPARWLDEYWFEGDQFLKPEDISKNAARGAFSAIVKLQRDSSGLLHGVRDILLTR